MELITVAGENENDAIRAAIGTLKNGGIVAYPTETFYGLGVRFDMDHVLERLFSIKKRPRFKAVPLIIGNRDLLPLLTTGINETSSLLMDRFWPGPLTFLLPAKGHISSLITSGTGNVAVRVPGESFALRLAQSADFPITSTSANPSGLAPAKDAGTVLRYFQSKIDLVIDGGNAPGGLPSTIIEVTGDDITILRKGAIAEESLFCFRG